MTTTLLLATPSPARADAARPSIVLKAGRLSDALRELSVRSGVDLLFAPDVVGDRRSPKIASTASIDEVLAQLLAGSGLSFKRTAGGAIVIFIAPAEQQEAPAVPEILVVGRKIQNADIRRTENDIQPYQVATSHDIVSSHADTIDVFLRERLPSDAESLPPSASPSNTATNRSEVNLHGLGSDQTLILIDGARMPSVPQNGFTAAMSQPDINGIPVLAIDRLVTLTGTAGGIYGPGATAGVINVILKRDYRGFDLSLTQGLSDRGDAARWRIDARLGFTPDHGDTDVMINFSRGKSDGLLLGDRDYLKAARQMLINRSPTGFLGTYPESNGIVFESIFGAPLSLKPALGGASLGSTFTYVPAGYAGMQSDGAATLVANAGKLTSALSPDGDGADGSLTNSTVITSLLANVRHRFGDNVEAFLDFIGEQDNGHAISRALTQGNDVVSSVAPNNPFKQDLVVLFPLPGFDSRVSNDTRTFRASAGLIAQLPYHWKVEANYSIGGVHDRVNDDSSMLNGDFSLAIGLDREGAGGEPAPNPFGDWSTFLAAVEAYKQPYNFHYTRIERFQDGSLRLAGPLAATKAGPISLTLLGEWRHEGVPGSVLHIIEPGVDAAITEQGFAQTVWSGYGEMRVPLVPRDSGFAPLHGLDLQLAVRYDDNRSISYDEGAAYAAHQTAAAYTGGLRFFPQDHLMLRASVATGVLPPTPAQLIPYTENIGFPFLYGDPERGGRVVGSEGPFTLLFGGSQHLQPEWARTLSFGFVLNPDGGDRPRFSVDFNHIRKRNEIVIQESGNLEYFLQNEAAYPGRIARAPLTAADRAAGFTGGVITAIDTTYLNVGRTVSDAVDFRADYTLRIGSESRLRLYGTATWQPRLTRWTIPGSPATHYVGFEDGPLRWRGNAGIDWERGPFTIGVNGQFYDRYYDQDASPGTADASELDQPGLRIPAQFYLDLSTAYRFALGDGPHAHVLELRFGIQNLFDHAPPIATDADGGYSTYGDARGRRFETTAAMHF